MAIFALEIIGEVQGQQPFYKLLKNNRCFFDEFYDEIMYNATYKSDLRSILVYMNLCANLQTLPDTKFKQIDRIGKARLYEFKSGGLRIYCLHEEQVGKIVIIGGYKPSQKQDISRFKNLAEEYLNSK